MGSEISNDESQQKLEELEEFIWRWNNHKQILKIINNSNIESEIVKKWEYRIDQCFSEKIKSKL